MKKMETKGMDFTQIENSGYILEKERPVKGIRRLAEFYQCSVQKIQDLINDGTIPSYKLGKNRYFYTSEVDKALRDRSLENESTSED